MGLDTPHGVLFESFRRLLAGFFTKLNMGMLCPPLLPFHFNEGGVLDIYGMV